MPDARFPATLPAASGANLTNLNGSNVASGTVGKDRIDADVRLIVVPYTFYDSGGLSDTPTIIVFRAPVACTLIEIHGKFSGGSSPSAQVNAARNNSDLHFSSNKSLSASFAILTPLQNTAYSSGHQLDFRITSISGGPTQVILEAVFRIGAA